MRAKSHDQRKGQWLVNKIRFDKKFQGTCERISNKDNISYSAQEKYMVEVVLWEMENDEFDRLMGDYYD